MRRKLKITSTILTLIGVLLILSVQVQAIPKLQIYIPNATYDTATETWVINSLEYDLWIIGAHEEIFDVKFAAAVSPSEDGTIDVTWIKGTLDEPGLKNKSVGFHDLLSETTSYDTSDGISFVEYGTPVMGNGSDLPPHGVFPSSYYEYWIGDFGLQETVHNYILGDDWMDEASGEVKKFHIQVSGYTWVDFVAYDHYLQTERKCKYVFSPFSHDGGGGSVPEPATMLLVGLGLLGLGLGTRKKRVEEG